VRLLFLALAGLCGLYSLLILIRVVLSWFGGANYGRPQALLSRITDPYLNWWRGIPGLRAGFLDLSPIAAMAVLSLAQSVFSTIAAYGRITLGIVLAIALSAIWQAISFILGFCLIILALRLIAYLTGANVYSGFWRIIDTISSPILYRINRIVFGRRLVNYLAGIITAIVLLGVIWAGGKIAVRLLAGLLIRLPV
jgi:YggT family protein